MGRGGGEVGFLRGGGLERLDGGGEVRYTGWEFR